MAEWYEELAAHKQEKWEPTQLSPEDEAKFKAYIMASPWFGQIKEYALLGGENLTDEQLYADLTGPNADYDLRGAWAEGVVPQPYEHDGGTLHWPSTAPSGKMLKSNTHPTAWMEFFMRHEGVDPHELGLRTEEEAIAYTQGKRRGN